MTEKSEEKEEIYLGNRIFSWRVKSENGYKINCHLYRSKSQNQPLNLGECNDGSKFTSVNQAVNQAKEFVNICNKMGW